MDDLWTLTAENFPNLTPEEQARLLRDLAHYARHEALHHPRQTERYEQLADVAFRLAARLDQDGPVGSREALPEDQRQVADLAAGVSRWAREQGRDPDPRLTDDDRPALHVLEVRAASLAEELDPERRRQLEREGR